MQALCQQLTPETQDNLYSFLELLSRSQANTPIGRPKIIQCVYLMLDGAANNEPFRQQLATMLDSPSCQDGANMLLRDIDLHRQIHCRREALTETQLAELLITHERREQLRRLSGELCKESYPMKEPLEIQLWMELYLTIPLNLPTTTSQMDFAPFSTESEYWGPMTRMGRQIVAATNGLAKAVDILSNSPIWRERIKANNEEPFTRNQQLYADQIDQQMFSSPSQSMVEPEGKRLEAIKSFAEQQEKAETQLVRRFTEQWASEVGFTNTLEHTWGLYS